MIQKIRIQNFRSIQDATVELGKVNLFIGPNNSGKSNMLKGIELMVILLKGFPTSSLVYADKNEYELLLTRGKVSSDIINFTIDYMTSKKDHFGLNFKYRNKSNLEFNFYNEVSHGSEFSFKQELPNSLINEAFTSVSILLNKSIVYKIDPSRYVFSDDLFKPIGLAKDGSNIVSFLFDLSQNHKKRFQQLEADLAACVVDLVSLSTPADPNEPGKLKLKFFDAQDRAFWAEEVSEGVLYFLALLCIVHQPDPPKLLLLEEPEKGIHPRRIREVMNFIFQLAEERDIQIIMTSHSPYVVDHFADIPECISVFDKEEGATVIRNAARDILEPLNKRNAEQNLPPVQYTDSLGEHWVSGFLGGVPL